MFFEHDFSERVFQPRNKALVESVLESNYSALAVPASLLSEFGGVGGYENTSSEQPGVDRVCSWSKARRPYHELKLSFIAK
jgi:hypothetical protein